jgi:hypothetical protein
MRRDAARSAAGSDEPGLRAHPLALDERGLDIRLQQLETPECRW